MTLVIDTQKSQVETPVDWLASRPDLWQWVLRRALLDRLSILLVVGVVLAVNLAAIEDLKTSLPDLELILIESGGDNLMFPTGLKVLNQGSPPH